MKKTSKMSLRGIYWLAFFGVILTSWAWLYAMSLSMNTDFFGRMNMQMSEMSSMDMSKEDMASSVGMMSDTGLVSSQKSMTIVEDDEGTFDVGKMASMPPEKAKMGNTSQDTGINKDMPMMGFSNLLGMWAVMMAAMMLPTMVPTLKSYEDLMQSADGTRAGWVGVLAGYGIVWVVFAALITLAQMALLYLNVVDIMGLATSIWLSAALLIASGAFQFTRAKEICHGVCHGPMIYFLGHWKTGFRGGLRMGLGLGVFCVGCCWLFMVLGFAGGVMNFLWMGLATLFMVLEKLPEIGHRVVRPAGFLLIITGLGLAFSSYLKEGVV